MEPYPRPGGLAVALAETVRLLAETVRLDADVWCVWTEWTLDGVSGDARRKRLKNHVQFNWTLSH